MGYLRFYQKIALFESASSCRVRVRVRVRVRYGARKEIAQWGNFNKILLVSNSCYFPAISSLLLGLGLG